MSYLAARGKLGPQASEEQVVSAAMTSVRQLSIASETLALVGAGNQLNWETQVKGSYNTVLDQFDNSIVAGLVNKASQGQVISPAELDAVMMQHNLMSQKLIKPAYVSDEQWGEVESRMTLQREFLQGLKDSRMPDAMKSDIVSQMMQAAETPVDAMAVSAASDPATFAASTGINLAETVNRVANSAFTDNNWKNRGRLLQDLTQVNPTEAVGGDTTFTVETAPDSMKKYLNLSRAEMKRNVDAGVTMMSTIKPADLQNEDTRKQFYNATISAAAGMMSEKEFYSSATISKVFGGANLTESLKMMDSLDKESADEIRVALRSVGVMQKTALENRVDSIENTMRAGGYEPDIFWDENDQKYYITNPEAIRHFTQIDSNGVTEKGYYIDPNNTVLAPRGLKDAYDHRKAIVILDKANKDLSVGVEETVRGTGSGQDINTAAVSNFAMIEGDREFLNEVGRTSNDLGIEAEDLLNAMSFETVGTFSPSVKNPNGSATGLIQFLESTAKGLGTTTAELRNMTRVEQMAYVKKYLMPYKGRMKNLGDVYMAIHWPAAVGKSDDYVMYREGSKAYTANKNLDKNKDGVITRKDALVRVNDHIRANSSGITTTELAPSGSTPTEEVVNTAERAIAASETAPTESLRPVARPTNAPTESLRPQASPIGNVSPRPTASDLAAAWDLLYGATHDPETGQLIQG